MVITLNGRQLQRPFVAVDTVDDPLIFVRSSSLGAATLRPDLHDVHVERVGALILQFFKLLQVLQGFLLF